MRKNRPMRPSLCLRGACLAVILSFLASAATAADEWPQFRGPDARGVSEDEALPDTWSKTENVAWATKIAGRGWASPIVTGNRVFVTTAVKVGGSLETIQPGLYFGGERATPTEPHRWNVLCLDFDSGKVLWEKTAVEAIPKQGHHLKNTLASETPVTDGKRVYAYFGNIGLFCYDLDGKLIWKNDLGSFPMAHNWGTGSSPVLHDGKLFIVHDNEQQSFAVAIDAETGKDIWRCSRNEKSNWSTPYVWTHDGRSELVTCGRRKVRSYDLNGKQLWELGGMSNITIPTPFSAHGLLYVASGYVLDERKPVFAIKPGATGDISLKPGEKSNESIAWFQPKAGPYNVSPLVYRDKFWVLYDMGFFACYDALTGAAKYERSMVRLPTGGKYTASPWAYNGNVFCLSEDGDTLVIPAEGEFKVTRTNKLDEFCMATPAIAHGSLLIRTETQLYRIAKKATRTAGR